MVFSSFIFLFLFLPASLLLYYATPLRGRNLALTLMSYLFYGWANPYFMLLLFASTLVSYYSALVMSRVPGHVATGEMPLLDEDDPRSLTQKGAFWISIAANLSLLVFFKYFNFGIDNYNSVVAVLGVEQLQVENFFRIALPLGISFYVFKMVSYTIDVSQGKVRATRSFVDFACYASLFPQLIAGALRSCAWGSPRRSCSPTAAARLPIPVSVTARRQPHPYLPLRGRYARRGRRLAGTSLL